MQKYFIEARQLLALAIPVILAQVAQTSMGFVDTVMAGGYSATDMAAVAIGTSIWLPAILFGQRPAAGVNPGRRSAQRVRGAVSASRTRCARVFGWRGSSPCW
ncbi:Multidrug-efflux transporter [Raoultella terrigena]|uniref:Multidrug-efflux transporter n=1 Tax=Raoultella terrigena TaxID=577 RepID=A0A3P8M0I8_RAOTE|nr:Multidrug-efflux transporter [Raoultella terrigena]